MFKISKIIGIISLVVISLYATGYTTHVIVSAKAKEAKFVGAILGVHVTFKNNLTGEVLAKGLASGGLVIQKKLCKI